ncbi:MAG: lyase family protein [Gemmataceae bacterium]
MPRIVSDSLGAVEVPDGVLWGPQTARATVHFAVGDERMPPEVIHALGLVKQAAAQVNHELGALDATRAAAVTEAAGEVASGALDDQFPLHVWQSGSGTQTNMNVNEVIAHRAGDGVHPNDHVNRSQSTNDAFPTAMHVAAALALSRELLPALGRLGDALEAKARLFAAVVKIGRTHLQDATPTVGQEVRGGRRCCARRCPAGQASTAACRPGRRRHGGRHGAEQPRVRPARRGLACRIDRARRSARTLIKFAALSAHDEAGRQRADAPGRRLLFSRCTTACRPGPQGLGDGSCWRNELACRRGLGRSDEASARPWHRRRGLLGDAAAPLRRVAGPPGA